MAHSRKKRKPSWLIRLLTGAALVTVMLLWLSAYSAHLYPPQHTLLPLFGLMFPFFLIGTCLFIPIWYFLERKRLLIPIIGLIVCIGDIRTYCPINLPNVHPKNALKVLSFNTMSFGLLECDSFGQIKALEYLLHSDADIICYQEGYPLKQKPYWPQLKKHIHEVYPHTHQYQIPGTENVLGIFSKYPITDVQKIDYSSDINGSIAYHLLLAQGDTLLVVNNHFQSNHLTKTDRGQYKQMIKNPENSDISETSRLLAAKIRRGGSQRAVQVDSVAAFLDRHKGESTILVGDFNDTPISYTHRTFAKRLTDAYVASGNGPGFSFNRDGIFVRIDNIFCSSDWKPYGCHIDRSIRLSDHFPIYCYLARH